MKENTKNLKTNYVALWAIMLVLFISVSLLGCALSEKIESSNYEKTGTTGSLDGIYGTQAFKGADSEYFCQVERECMRANAVTNLGQSSAESQLNSAGNATNKADIMSSETVAMPVNVDAKSAYLIDSKSGTVLFSRDENKRLPIASMTKIMTALLVFENIKSGKISLDDMVTVSENAEGMGGSQIFLDAHAKYSVSELLKSVIVGSANDSSVCLAEYIAGTEMAFVELMNKKAVELKMTNTHFANATGLPASEHFSSAKDTATMFCELIGNEDYFKYSKIWLEDFKHPSGRTTVLTNTNKLVKYFDECDGGKTGFTSESKFCLSATAVKGDMRLVAVTIGSSSSKERFRSVSDMFRYAFGNYKSTTLYKKGTKIENNIFVNGGKRQNIEIVINEDISAFVKNGEKAEYQLKFELPQKIKAEIKLGDQVGKCYLIKNGIVEKSYAVKSNETIERANLLDIIKKFAQA